MLLCARRTQSSGRALSSVARIQDVIMARCVTAISSSAPNMGVGSATVCCSLSRSMLDNARYPTAEYRAAGIIYVLELTLHIAISDYLSVNSFVFNELKQKKLSKERKLRKREECLKRLQQKERDLKRIYDLQMFESQKRAAATTAAGVYS